MVQPPVRFPCYRHFCQPKAKCFHFFHRLFVKSLSSCYFQKSFPQNFDTLFCVCVCVCVYVCVCVCMCVCVCDRLLSPPSLCVALSAFSVCLHVSLALFCQTTLPCPSQRLSVCLMPACLFLFVCLSLCVCLHVTSLCFVRSLCPVRLSVIPSVSCLSVYLCLSVSVSTC